MNGHGSNRRPLVSRTVAVLALLWGLGAGCASVKQARLAQDATRAPAGERTVRAAEIGLTSNTVVALDDAVLIALSYHPAVTQARQARAAALAQLDQARGAYWPSVSANASYGRGTANTAGTPGSHQTTGAYNASLGLDLLLYDFGKTPALVRQACFSAMAADENLRTARNDTAYAVRAAFFDLLRAQELAQVSEEAVRQYQEHLNQVKAFAEVGRRIRYDVTKAEVDLGNAQLSLIVARNGLTTARAALNRSLGLAEEPGFRLRESLLAEVPGDIASLMNVAREHHPGLRSLRDRERVASAAVDAAIADLYPSLGLHGSYALSGPHLPFVWNWSGALQSAINLLDGGRTKARIAEATAQLRSARAQVADREQQIYLDLTQALAQLAGARQRTDLTALIVRQAQESLNLATERYRLGQASSVELTDAQVAVTQARADQVKARFDYQTALAQIRHSIGKE